MIKPVVADSLLVLFGGAGLATKGLVNSGCAKRVVSVELDPVKHHLSKILNPTVEHINADVRELSLKFISQFTMIWSSPPCQGWSEQGTETANSDGNDLLWWSLGLQNDVLWVENVISGDYPIEWGKEWNAAQFLPEDELRQRRRRLIGGRYRYPYQYRSFQSDYPKHYHQCPPAVLASEIGHGGRSLDPTQERRKASRWYLLNKGRDITLDDMAYAQGFDIPDAWREPMDGFTDAQWRRNLSTGIGNGVPVYMAQAFGEAYSKPQPMPKTRQLELI